MRGVSLAKLKAGQQIYEAIAGVSSQMGSDFEFRFHDSKGVKSRAAFFRGELPSYAKADVEIVHAYYHSLDYARRRVFS